MPARITLAHVRSALEAKDPAVVDLVCRLVRQDDPPEPTREGAYSFRKFIAETQNRQFRRKPADEQAQLRVEKLAQLEAADADPQLSDQLRCHEILFSLWQTDDPFSRDCLVKIIAEVPLIYGPFKAMKRIFKEAEEANDTEIYGALAARFDMAFDSGEHGISQRTLGYLCRRAWRYLRRSAQALPACYADVATDFLVHYVGWGPYYNTWIFNHILFHETGLYDAKKFTFKSWDKQKSRPKDWVRYRAFADLWKRTPRPLFTLLERARGEVVRYYAASALKADFRAALREVEPSWVARLVSVGSEEVDEFVVWILNNVPKFEQAKFAELGLHDAVLRLFDSQAAVAQKYAAAYARTYARDLPVEQLVRLANSNRGEVRKLAVDLLLSRDPRKDIGLAAWGQLLETEHGSETAARVLRKHFGASELTPAWLAERIRSDSDDARQFAQERLLALYSPKQLGWKFFAEVALDLDPNDDHGDYEAGKFLMEQLGKLDLSEIETETLQEILLHPHLRYVVWQSWVHEGKLKASAFDVDFLKRIAYHIDFDQDPRVQELHRTRPWGREYVRYNGFVADTIFSWLRDVRQFSPDQLGFEWLMQLVQRAEPRYHDFAVDTMIRAFLPADFAPSDIADDPQAEESAGSDEINVDLGGASFVFTGKLNTMTRGEAQGKVTAAGGANSNAVNKKLDYLVIGDEGSPLYGQGRKGSKQTKAEKLNEDGAGIHIISETAFLQMLAGEQREFSADAVEAGCEQLWSMLLDHPPDSPLGRFARKYIRRHHPDICLEETDRPVDPGAEMPADWLNFERVKPLFSESRKPLRDLALELAKWDFARWSPPIEGLVEICESPYGEVREFVAKAMTADEAVEHRRYRVDPEVLTADAVYSFCDSRNEGTRGLGMKLIEANPRLRVPEELFRLTESTDGQVRGFVIRTFWNLYRERGITASWKPKPPPVAEIKKRKSKEAEENVGPGAPDKPERMPAEITDMQSLLRRILYELPPGRPPKSSVGEKVVKLRPLPARDRKLKLVETLRDLAIQEIELARHVLPVLREFVGSRGKSEQAAALVAVTRIEHTHGELEALAAS